MLEKDTSPEAVGKRLRYVRKNMANLGREEFSTLADVGKTSISCWENAKDETSAMTPRSMAKVVEAFRKKGIECTERWLRTGTGPAPRFIAETHEEQPLNEQDIIESKPTPLPTQPITNDAGDEIKRFMSRNDLSVIAKVDTNCMYPALEKGDIVGGIWQPAHTIKAAKICIIEVNGKIQVRRLIPSNTSGLFNITFLTLDPNQLEPFEMLDIQLEKLAPVIRLWR